MSTLNLVLPDLNEPLFDCLGNIVEKPTERWFDIKGYEGLYIVSSEGRVKGLDRYIKRSRGGLQIKRGHILKPSTSGKGYLSVALCLNGKSTTKYIHHLVASAFLPRPKGAVIDHINRNPKDNRIENLRYCTQRENLNNISNKSKIGATGVTLNSPAYKKKV